MAAPSGMPPGDVDSTYRGHSALVFIGIFLALQLVVVWLRYITKLIVRVPWGYDDILVLASLVLQIGLAAIAFDALLNSGVGYHLSYVLSLYPQRFTRWLKELFALTFIYNFAAILPKLAILIFYDRIFGRNAKYIYYSVRILFTILSIYAVILTIIVLATCRPIAANWDKSIEGATCLNNRTLAAWIVVPNILTDIWMLILPMPVILKLQVTKRLRIGLFFNFLIASIGLVASIARFVVNLTTGSSDATWEAAELLIWLQLEPGCYLISACLPTLRPLLDRVANWIVARLPTETISRTFGSKHSRTVTGGSWNVQSTFRAPVPPSGYEFERLDDEREGKGGAQATVKGHKAGKPGPSDQLV